MATKVQLWLRSLWYGTCRKCGERYNATCARLSLHVTLHGRPSAGVAHHEDRCDILNIPGTICDCAEAEVKFSGDTEAIITFIGRRVAIGDQIGVIEFEDAVRFHREVMPKVFWTRHTPRERTVPMK